jgi:hypothetical protein
MTRVSKLFPSFAFCRRNAGFRGAAGLGFEPRLTDPLESVSIHPWLFTANKSRPSSTSVKATAPITAYSDNRL